jgi:S1-C subfamily serine protease
MIYRISPILRTLLILLILPGPIVSDTLRQQSQSFNTVYTMTRPAIVSIHTKKHRPKPTLYYTYKMDEKNMIKSGLGSGVLISSDGYILTNFHVISGKNDIKIHLMDGQVFNAKVIGTDQRTDLASLKLKGIIFLRLQSEIQTI